VEREEEGRLELFTATAAARRFVDKRRARAERRAGSPGPSAAVDNSHPRAGKTDLVVPGGIVGDVDGLA
jgi:hypothetical protein